MPEQQRPPQQQDQPGVESEMIPRPESQATGYRAAGKLRDKVAIVTGGDSGIGRAVAVAFAKEGADLAIAYLEEHEDARETARLIGEVGRQCLVMAGDVGDEAFARSVVDRTLERFGRLDILVNNAAEQHERESLDDIDEESLVRTFRTNIFSHVFLTKAAVPHLKPGSAIINTTSVTAYRGSGRLPDYAATKGAILALTRSLSQMLLEKGIRVNAVAPGPVWTPLIPASFDPQDVAIFGSQAPMGRAGQPDEIAPSYVFLASDDASFFSGQVLHPNGGEIVGG